MAVLSKCVVVASLVHFALGMEGQNQLQIPENLKDIFEAVDKSQNEHGKLNLKNDQTLKNYVSLAEVQLSSLDGNHWVRHFTNCTTLADLQKKVKDKLPEDEQEFVNVLD